MTDDLVKRMRAVPRDYDLYDHDIIYEAADRIEELEGALCRIWVLNQRGDKFKDEIDMVVSTAMDGKTND